MGAAGAQGDRGRAAVDLAGAGVLAADRAGLGLIIGGAIGNAIDRLPTAAVADFVLFHVTTASFSFNWYVFNLADVAIVAGVIGLLYETLLGRPTPQKRPDPGHK